MATKRRSTKKKHNVIESTAYRQKEIQIVGEDEGNVLLVEDEKVDCVRDDVSGSYSSCLFPYQTFGSPQEIAKALIDNEVEGKK